MKLSIVLNGVILGLLCCNSDAVRMTLQPNNVVIGGGTNNPIAVPTISSQQLTMECTVNGTSSIDKIYSLYIKRKRFQDLDYTTFATIESGTNQAILRENAPSDIVNKNPTLDGQINNNNIYSSVLRVRILISRLDCLDEASYQCEMNYLPLNVDSIKVSSIENLQVTVLPGNLVIGGAMFDDYFGNAIQNMTMLQSGRQYEFTCTGEIGMSQGTIITWYYKVPPFTFQLFQQVTLTNPMDSIDNGIPSTTICPYTRTSKLRYTPTNFDQDLIVRCEVRAQTNTGASVSATSAEFHLVPRYLSTSSTNIPTFRGTVTMVMIVVIAVTNVLT